MLTNRAPQATLPSSDLQRAARFYEEKLGLRRAAEQAPAGVRPGSVIYESGGARFSVIESSGAASGTHTRLAWCVDDVESEVVDLKAKGVVFEEYDLPQFKTVGGIAESASARAAWFSECRPASQNAGRSSSAVSNWTWPRLHRLNKPERALRKVLR